MIFTSLEYSLQQRCLNDLRRSIRMILQDMNYVVVEKDKSFITDEFVAQVIVYL